VWGNLIGSHVAGVRISVAGERFAEFKSIVVHVFRSLCLAALVLG
jgi:hypothetical protein